MGTEKARRAQELREQEVFMKLSTGKHLCGNCDWVYDETKGDSMMIGGMIKPDTKFDGLPANWRCPVCRASKDSFNEVVEEIPGFEVNQGYGFGTNSYSRTKESCRFWRAWTSFYCFYRVMQCLETGRMLFWLGVSVVRISSLSDFIMNRYRKKTLYLDGIPLLLF